MSSLPPASASAGGQQTPAIPAPQAAPPAEIDENNPATWGDNREDAPEEIQSALRQLVYHFELENSEARIEQIRKVLHAREMFAGRQIVYWSEREFRYKQPTREEIGDEDYQDLELISNVIQGYCLILMAELSQDPPRTSFMPEQPSQRSDVRLAKAGSEIISYINRNNKIEHKLPYECWLLFNDASFAEYWRFVRDASKYGVETYQEAEGTTEKELAPDRAVCPGCGATTPVVSPDAAPPMCQDPTCAAPMGPASFSPAITEQVPNMVTKTRPAGQEVCDVVGMLELSLPAYEKNEEELGFLTWCREVHKARLKATWPKAAQKIGQAVGLDTSASQAERSARLSLLGGWARHGDGRMNLITYRETWLQPWTFNNVEDPDMVKKLAAFYPSGAYVAFAGDTYCGSRDEDHRKHWTLTHAFPGDGQYRQGIGSAAIASQRKFNQVDSIERETYDRALPFMIADTDVFDPRGLGSRRPEGGDIVPATARGNKTVTNSIYETKPGAVSEQMLNYKERQMKLIEHQTGSLPALFGGELGGNDTARGIAIERNAARGRVGLIFRSLKDGRARADLKNIALFRDNRTQDVEIAVAGEGSAFKAKTISLEDIKDGSVKVRAESDESYPVSLNEQKQVILNLLTNQNPAVLRWFMDPASEERLAELIGVTDLVRIPGVNERDKCFDIIDQLLQGQPQAPPPPMEAPGMPPMPPGPPEPSVEPDPVLDDLQTYIATCREWASSEAGREAAVENPGGYQNVRAFVAKCMAILTPPPMPGPPPGAPGAPQPAGPPQPGMGGPDAGAPGPM